MDFRHEISKTTNEQPHKDGAVCQVALHRFVALLLVLLLHAPGAWAQRTDTVLQLPVAEITASNLREANIGSRQETWDSTWQLGQNIGDRLGSSSGIFLKTYGLGSLATTSIRGAAAVQTAVVWEGFSLRNPALGLIDLSLLPSVFADEISLQFGGGSAAWGSGAIGGTILLQNKPQLGRGFGAEAGLGLGSFGQRIAEAKLRFGRSNWASATRAFHQRATNDFSYPVGPGLPRRQQTNAALRQSGLLQEFHFKPAANQLVSSSVWAQTSSRELPPTSTQSRSMAHQADDLLRATLHWKSWGPHAATHAKAGLFYEKIDYRDEQTGLVAISRFWTEVAELDHQWEWGKAHRLQVGANQTFTKAFSDNYAQPPERHELAMFAAYTFQQGKWQLQANARQGLADGERVPFVPSLGLCYAWRKGLKLRAQTGRNFRLPTLNDLYWQPGGNAGLQPESGWSAELGLDFSLKRKIGYQYGVTVFHRRIQNWILWHLAEAAAYYTPANLAEVWSRGIEQRASLGFSLGPHTQVALALGYDLVHSTNEVAVSNPRLAAGEQLAYVPIHQAFGQLSIGGDTWEARYLHRFTGPVTTLTDPLDAYQLGSLGARKRLHLARFDLNFFIQIENLWNKTYRVVERRPMPGRYLQSGFSLRFP